MSAMRKVLIADILVCSNTKALILKCANYACTVV